MAVVVADGGGSVSDAVDVGVGESSSCCCWTRRPLKSADGAGGIGLVGDALVVVVVVVVVVAMRAVTRRRRHHHQTLTSPQRQQLPRLLQRPRRTSRWRSRRDSSASCCRNMMSS